jgi:GT2 family glycosyltransferase
MMQTADAPEIACVLINWNNWQDTCACVTSLAQQDYPNLRVLVVDNASSNDSVAQIRAQHPWVTILESPENDGFPRACNLGARHPLAASAHYFWFLNNDTIVPPDTARKLLDKAQADPRAGVIGSVLYYMHAPRTIQAWGGGKISRWTGYNTHFISPNPLGPDSYLTFASVLIPRPCFNQLNGMYEGAFMYFEDCDFCLRASAAGWHLSVAETTAILHKEGGSGIGPTPRMDRIITTAGLLFMDRHASVPLVSRALFLASRLAKRIVLLRPQAFMAVLQGACDHAGRPAARPISPMQ